jgi:dipeptide/tripeptide permease
MEHIHTALRFSEWALEFIVVPPFCFAFVLAGISFVWAGQRQRPFQTHLWKPYHWLALTHLLFFAAAIVVGVLGANQVTNRHVPHSGNQTAKLCLDAVMYGSLISCGFWI